MSVIGSNILAGASGQAGYNLTKSLRFRSSASAYLNRTPASASNRQIATWSGWIKRGLLSSNGYLFSSNDGGGSAETYIEISGSDQLNFAVWTGSAYSMQVRTTQVFRDPSAWYHIVCAVDTTQATASNRAKIYVNGVQVTALANADYPTQNLNTGWNNTTVHNISRSAVNAGRYFDGYFAEINFIDGQALTPSSFGETSTTTGVWIPKKFTGTYGTNGFYLPFTDTTSTSTLGTDFSGNSNTWTVNNISLTSGSTYDSMNDVPTLTSATTANYSVLNPVSNLGNGSISNGNLGYVATTFGWVSAAGTTFVSSGKWYYEVTLTTFSGGGGAMIGVCNTGFTAFNSYAGSTANSWSVQASESTTNKWNNNSSTLLATEVSAVGNVFMLAYDVDAGKVWFGRNGTWYSSGDPAAGTNAAFTNLSGSLGVVVSSISTTSAVAVNCGQRPFSYTPPTGFVALNTFNLPTPTIGATASTTANKYFDAKLYTGNGGTQSITGFNFSPDFIWAKSRSNAVNHNIYDSIRGVNKLLSSSLTDAEYTGGTGLTSFNSDGYTTGSDSWLNASGQTYVAWGWDANGAGSSNTAGSITSTVSANTTAGFSVVSYTASSSASTIGHGLGVAPSMIIQKNRDAVSDWGVYHISVGATKFLKLNDSAAAATNSVPWNDTTPTSTVFSIGTGYTSGNKYVAYCFAEVAGYSAMGSYTGNGSSDGPFIFTGFRPRYVMIKRSDSTADWNVRDTARSPNNVVGEALYPNLNLAEYSGTETYLDILSNGFKLRGNWNSSNASGGTYIYMAFAENPFKYANAR